MTDEQDKMNPEIKAKWTGALTSKEYQQGRGRLRCADKFCCLGVLTDLYIKETGKGQWIEQRDGAFGVLDPAGIHVFHSIGAPAEWTCLPKEVAEWAGLSKIDPEVFAEEDAEPISLADLNDDGTDFAEIAKVIDANL